MNNKEKIIQLAKEKGFKSKFFHEEPFKYSENEELRWYLYLFEISFWATTKIYPDTGKVWVEELEKTVLNGLEVLKNMKDE